MSFFATHCGYVRKISFHFRKLPRLSIFVKEQIQDEIFGDDDLDPFDWIFDDQIIINEICPLNFIVKSYLLRKLLAYQRSFVRFVQERLATSSVVLASGLRIASLCEVGSMKGSRSSLYLDDTRQEVDPEDKDVRSSMQLRMYCFTDEQWICDAFYEDPNAGDPVTHFIQNRIVLEYKSGGDFEFETLLGYCTKPKAAGGMGRVVVHKAFSEGNRVRFSYCLKHEDKATP